MKVTVLSGGVGAARFLRGLLAVVPAAEVTAIVNTGDDTVLHGLDISPDLDTITYTLAGAIDPERGWGLEGETWRAMEALERYTEARPAGSRAAPTWFNLGDRDLATHFYRTARRREGATLTQVTREISSSWGLELTLLPMSDQRLSTMITLATGDEISFQDYFVRLRHSVPISSIRFDSDGSVRPTHEVLAAIESADVIVVAPSNPLVSIGPIRALPDIDQLLSARRDRVVAVSPIVGGSALKGPADRMLHELGMESTVTAVAELYTSIAGALVIDPADRQLVDSVRSHRMRALVVPSVMSTPERAAALARACLDAVD